MKQNTLIEVGSKANVILRFIVPTEINGKTYAAKEPYLYLKDVDVIINYTNQSKIAQTDKSVLAFSDIKPRVVTIASIPFSRKVVSLLSKFKNTDKTFNPTIFRSLAASREAGEDEGVIFLVDELDATKDWFVYNSNFDPIDATYNAEMNSLTSEDFLDGEQYLISFSSVEQGTEFELNKPCLPYMSLEIQGIGNLDKTTKKVYLFFAKVSLDSNMEFTFIQDEIINIPLDFNIIDDTGNLLYFED